MTRLQMRASLITSLLSTMILIIPSPASAEENAAPEELSQETIAEARARFDRGIELFDGGQFEASLAEFYRAYEIAPNYVVLLNIALAYERLGRPAQAVGIYQRYLDEGGDRIAPERHAEVEETLERLRRDVGRITVRVTGPERAILAIDDVEVGQLPLDEPVSVSAGSHIVEVQAEGYHSTRREVIVAGQAQVELEIELTPIAVTVEPPPPPPPEDPPPVEPEPPLPPPPAGPPELTARGRTFRTVSYVMAGLAVAALGASVGLFVWNDGRLAAWEDRDRELSEELLIADEERARELELELASHHDNLDAIEGVTISAWVLVGAGVAFAATWAGLFFGAPRESASRVPIVSLVPQRQGAFLGVNFEL